MMQSAVILAAVLASLIAAMSLDALLEDVAALGRKSKVAPAELKAVAEKHADARQKK